MERAQQEDGGCSRSQAVRVDDHLYDQKSHDNPLSCLMEIVANSVEHGQAHHVALEVERGYYAVTETGGLGLDGAGLKRATCSFGGHEPSSDGGGVAGGASAAGTRRLAGFSHNGIGTKSPLRFYNERLVLSATPHPQKAEMEYRAAYFARELTGKGTAGKVLFVHWPDRKALMRGAAGASEEWGPATAADILRLCKPRIHDFAQEFDQIGACEGGRLGSAEDCTDGPFCAEQQRPAKQGCRWIYWTDTTLNDGGVVAPFAAGRTVEVQRGGAGSASNWEPAQILAWNPADSKYSVVWDPFDRQHFDLSPHSVRPSGGWPIDLLQVAPDDDGRPDVTVAEEGNQLLWVSSLRNRLKLCLARVVCTFSLNGDVIKQVTPGRLLTMLDPLPCFTNEHNFLASPDQSHLEPALHSTQRGATEALIEKHDSEWAATSDDLTNLALLPAGAANKRKGLVRFVWHDPSGVSARLVLGEIDSINDSSAGDDYMSEIVGPGGQSKSGGGLVCWCNGAHIPLSELLRLGKSGKLGQGGRRLGSRVHGTLELMTPPHVSVLDSGKERLNLSVTMRSQKALDWLIERVDFYLQALKFYREPRLVATKDSPHTSPLYRSTRESVRCRLRAENPSRKPARAATVPLASNQQAERTPLEGASGGRGRKTQPIDRFSFAELGGVVAPARRAPKVKTSKSVAQLEKSLHESQRESQALREQLASLQQEVSELKGQNKELNGRIRHYQKNERLGNAHRPTCQQKRGNQNDGSKQKTNGVSSKAAIEQAPVPAAQVGIQGVQRISGEQAVLCRRYGSSDAWEQFSSAAAMATAKEISCTVANIKRVARGAKRRKSVGGGAGSSGKGGWEVKYVSPAGHREQESLSPEAVQAVDEVAGTGQQALTETQAPKRVMPTGDFVCPVCSRVFGSKKAVAGHQRHCKPEAVQAVDEVAGTGQQALTETRAPKRAMPTGDFVCPVCGRAFGSKKALAGHQRHCRSERPWDDKSAGQQHDRPSGSVDDIETDMCYKVGDRVSVAGNIFAASAPHSKFYGYVSAIYTDGRARPFEISFDDGDTHDLSTQNISKVVTFTVKARECAICHDDLLSDPEAIICKLSCGHAWHNECIEKWSAQPGVGLTCPGCRDPSSGLRRCEQTVAQFVTVAGEHAPAPRTGRVSRCPARAGFVDPTVPGVSFAQPKGGVARTHRSGGVGAAWSAEGEQQQQPNQQQQQQQPPPPPPPLQQPQPQPQQQQQQHSSARAQEGSGSSLAASQPAASVSSAAPMVTETDLRRKPVLCRMSDSDGAWERYETAELMAKAKGVRVEKVINVAAKICRKGRDRPPQTVGGGHWSKPGWNVNFSDDRNQAPKRSLQGHITGSSASASEKKLCTR
eukprot:COSAG01_NODE_2204_length_8173_cov_4.803939_5_plen_1368_part_00